ncbi:ABC transporter [Aureimonas fodinaquatilis]|uniref:ABC transporter n=2 Tax=Aureimonas fodinaquatilis TaxID=2565783 RepID=A0A5B0E332_9HYPH|nr:ABC transporter [Aureimonas fodinaquatilis]
MAGKTFLKAGILAAVALSLSACASLTPPPQTFDLNPPTRAVAGTRVANIQVLVPEPTTNSTLDSERIVVMPSTQTVEYLGGSQWSDRLPRLVQLQLVQAFQNSGRVAAVGIPGQGLAIDYQVVIEIRHFEISYASGSPVANIELAVKALNDKTGIVRATRIFKVSEPVSGQGSGQFVAALNSAFDRLSLELVEWFVRAA